MHAREASDRTTRHLGHDAHTDHDLAFEIDP
jgi:hypothetical protein